MGPPPQCALTGPGKALGHHIEVLLVRFKTLCLFYIVPPALIRYNWFMYSLRVFLWELLQIFSGGYKGVGGGGGGCHNIPM